MQFIASALCVTLMAITWVFGQLVKQCRRVDAYLAHLLDEVL